MPVISQFYGIRVTIFYSDHGEPHFHAYYAESSMKMTIRDRKVVAGEFPKRALKLITVWAKRHEDELMTNWSRAEKHKVLNYIQPLE